MIVGVVLLQLATGNQLVRLVLGSVGAVKPAGEPQASDRLKGGRLLGPMERLLILGLGLAGQLAAGDRGGRRQEHHPLPRDQRHRRPARTDRSASTTVTEYFLVGSFASWIVALGGLVLAQ